MKLFTIALLLFLLQVSLCKASEVDLFEVPTEEIERSFESLNKLESYIENHPTETISSVKLNPNFSELASSIKPLEINSLKASHGSGTFLSFVAGFCCGIPGIALVFFTSDKDERKTEAAIIGGLVITVIAIIAQVAIISGM